MVAAALVMQEAAAIAAKAGHRVERERVAVARAEPSIGAELKDPQTALMREVHEPMEILRRRWAGPLFLHDWFLLPLAQRFQTSGPLCRVGAACPNSVNSTLGINIYQ